MPWYDKPVKPGSYGALIRQARSGRIAGDEREEQQRGDDLRKDIANAIEQSKRSSEKTAVSDSTTPRNWKEFIPATIWTVIILGFGLEFVTRLVGQEYGRALFALRPDRGNRYKAWHRRRMGYFWQPA